MDYECEQIPSEHPFFARMQHRIDRGRKSWTIVMLLKITLVGQGVPLFKLSLHKVYIHLVLRVHADVPFFEIVFNLVDI